MKSADDTASSHAMTRLEASRLLGERDALPTPDRKRIAKATQNGHALDDPHERDLQRAALLEGRGARRVSAVGLIFGAAGMMLTLLGRLGRGDGLRLWDAFAVVALVFAPFVWWQLWRQRALERHLGPTPETRDD